MPGQPSSRRRAFPPSAAVESSVAGGAATIIRNRVVLPAPLGPITPTIPPGGRLKVRVVDQQPVPEALGETGSASDHLVTETWTGGW